MFKRKILILLSLTVLLAIVNAAVFVYYTTDLSLSPVAPPIVFSNGKNANAADLLGTTIEVTIGRANTSLTITLHPTYQYNYYKNITIIKNQDTTNAYYVAIRVNTQFSNEKISSATLRIYDTSSTIATVGLKSTGTTGWLGPLNPNSKWFIDIILNIDETGGSPSTAPFTSDSASLQLIYSPQSNEQAPTVP
jgi:hypothetical protein